MNPQPKPTKRTKAPRKALRRSWMRRKSTRLRKGADPAYVAWVHAQPCVGLEGLGEGYEGHVCRNRFGSPTADVEQSHIRDRTGMGQKAPDRMSVPMCGDLHRRWEEHLPPFWLWGKEDRRVWFMARIIEENARYDAQAGGSREERGGSRPTPEERSEPGDRSERGGR